jgi:hypothetical protein
MQQQNITGTMKIVKYYLVLLLLVIMFAGARTMFEIAYQGMAFEHDEMSKKVAYLIGIAGWFVLMMIADVWVLMHPKLKQNLLIVLLLSIGVWGPAIFLAFFR